MNSSVKKLTEAAILTSVFIVITMFALTTGLGYGIYLDFGVPIMFTLIYFRCELKYTLLSGVSSILIILLVHFIFKGRCPEYVRLLDLYAGFGAVLGHNFPFFLKFKGGKGIATTAGVILAVCPLGVPVSIILFVTTVLITRYVSLGSILVVLAFLIQTIIFNYNGLINIGPAYVLEFDIVVACFTVMAIWRHRANISRLLNGTENKFGQKAK